MNALERLIAGFKAFRARYFEHRPEIYQRLSGGQAPEVLIVACSDSRADPAILLSAEPGELFVIRNVANLVPPYQPDGHYHGTSAAIEFAVRDLNVRHVVVLGHSACAGVHALIDPKRGEPREFIAEWVAIAGRARAALAADSVRGAVDESRRIEQAAIRVSLENLMSFPWVASRLKAGTLSLHGWWFELEAGELWGIDGAAEEFKALT
jgi:carbonic anhydrase